MLHLGPVHSCWLDVYRWPASTIARRARIRPCTLRPYSQPRAIESQQRAPPGRYGMNVHHRRAHPHPCHFGLKYPLQLPSVHVSKTYLGGLFMGKSSQEEKRTGKLLKVKRTQFTINDGT